MAPWDLDLVRTEAEALGEWVEKQARVLEYASDFLWPSVVLTRKRKGISTWGYFETLLLEVFLPIIQIV